MKRALLMSAILLAACTADEGPVGEATATITQVPAGVACIQIQVVGSRTVTKNIDVTAGQSSVVSLPNLPVGADTFSASAFAASCASVNMGGAIASWQADPVVAVIAAGAVTPVTLAMHGVGGANVGVDFPDDGGTTAVVDLAQPPPTDGGVMLVDLANPDLTTLPDLTAPADLACVPMTAGQACMLAGQVCGSVSNGCGGFVSCGTCAGVCCLTQCLPGGGICP